MIGDLYERHGETTIEWRIKDFFLLPQVVNIRYVSQKFYFSGTFWELWIYPNGESEYNSEGWVDLFLMRMSNGSPLSVVYTLKIKSIDDRNSPCFAYVSSFQKKRDGWGKQKFISKAELLEQKYNLTPFGTLTIICTLKNSKLNSVARSSLSRQQEVIDTLKEIYEKAKMTDLVLKIEGQDIKAHRMILEARSPVFAAMFRHNTKENQTGEISIDDVDRHSMDAILTFMYCGDIEDLTIDNALPMYAAAEKYDIKDVKAICSEFITKNLSKDCICGVLKFSTLYEKDDIYHRSREYFKRNVHEILKSENWKTFAEENPTMSIELLALVVKAYVPEQSLEIDIEN